MIEKAIHQIWLGERKPPSSFTSWRGSWIEKFPDWSYRLWTDKDLPEVLPLMVDTTAFDHHLNVALRSDILRLELLRLFGGIYADVDFECLHNFEWMFRPGCFHYGDESAYRPANSLLVSARDHGFLTFMLEAIARHLKHAVATGGTWESVQQISGPDALHRALQSWVWLWRCDEVIVNPSGQECGGRHRDVVCFASQSWFPYHWEQKQDWQDAVVHNEVARRYPMAVAVHHWAGSWL